MRPALDTNILVYSELEPDSEKGRAARLLIRACVHNDGIIAVQVLGELLAVVRRRRPDLLSQAVLVVDALAEALEAPPTTVSVMAAAAALSRNHGLQVWDAVICTASAEAGATHLLSEDMHDGFGLAGLTIVNPFLEANRDLLRQLLPRVP